MTGSQPGGESQSPYRLRTFGTLSLVGAENDTLLGKHGHQRRRLALLAVLAAAGDAGRSRDQLLLLFWPDATQARARHSLEQLLYAIRTSVHEEVFDGANPVRLNRSVVSSDVDDFNQALKRKDLAGAVAEYRGPFLDGFYLSESPEFEQWLDAERARLARSYAGALEALAHNAEKTGDYATAVKWWRNLSEADPVSSRNAIGLIQALANAGDHAAALQYADQYEATVSRELGTHVGPGVSELVARVRADSQSSRAVVHAEREPAAVERASIVASESTPAVPSRVVAPSRPRWLLPGAVTLVAAALIVAAWIRFSARDASTTKVEPSIAVLPFENVTGKSDDRVFVDGLTEELTAQLARLSGLQVVGRTSAFGFRNSQIGARQIADSLHVSNLLEGSVQRSGGNLRVQVRLIDPARGTTRWSETYNRELKDVFAVQSEIAREVARELDLRLRGTTVARMRKPRTTNIAAYDAYLLGNDPASTRSDSAALASLENFRRAIELDSGYAEAYAGFARMQLRNGSTTNVTVPRSQRVVLGEQAARKAISLDPDLPDAHASLAFVMRAKLELGSYLSEMERAVALDPTDARLREWLAQAYIMMNRPHDALRQAQRGLEIDPLSPTAAAEVAHSLQADHKCNAAYPYLARLSALRPPLLRTSTIAARCYLMEKKWQEAIDAVRKTEANAGPSGMGLLGFAHARAGRTTESRRILASLIERTRARRVGAADVAIIYAGLGEKDSAFAWLDTAIADRELGLNHDLVLEEFPNDPRTDAFLRRLGIQKR